jgi:hypothetical protein
MKHFTSFKCTCLYIHYYLTILKKCLPQFRPSLMIVMELATLAKAKTRAKQAFIGQASHTIITYDNHL